MDSYVESQYQNLNHHPHNQENDQQHQNSGLLRFRSAPSSLFFEYTNQLSHTHKQINNNGSLEEEEEEDYSESYEKKPQVINIGYSTTNSSHELLPPQYPKQSVVSTSNSMEINQSETSSDDNNNGGRLNLNRQSSSPAGFFSQLNPQNGYTVMRGLGSFRVGNGTSDEASPRASRLSMSHLPGIPEIGNEIVKETSPDEVKFRHHEDDPGYDSPGGYSFTSWNDSGSDASHLSENGGLLNRGSMLSHHLSLPKTSTEMAAIEKLLHFQDATPCKVRAKRGCATHPRSIAERVRRNRISERMRKLQDLVPNMDKQTNTADMLDLAVDYIKNLQNEFKVLSDVRAKCQCIHLQ